MLPVAVGLAIPRGGTGVSQVNLLPPELRQPGDRDASPRSWSVALGVLALVGLFHLLQVQRLPEAQDKLEAQQARNADLEGQIAGLQEFAALQAELCGHRGAVATIFVNEVSWSSALLDVSRVIPTRRTSRTSPARSRPPWRSRVPPRTGGTPDTTLIGDMTFQSVAQGIDTMYDLAHAARAGPGLELPSILARKTCGLSTPFSNVLDLTQEAATARGLGESTCREPARADVIAAASPSWSRSSLIFLLVLPKDARSSAARRRDQLQAAQDRGRRSPPSCARSSRPRQAPGPSRVAAIDDAIPPTANHCWRSSRPARQRGGDARAAVDFFSFTPSTPVVDPASQYSTISSR